MASGQGFLAGQFCWGIIEHLLSLLFLRTTRSMFCRPEENSTQSISFCYKNTFLTHCCVGLNLKSPYVSLLSSRSRVIISSSWRIIAHGWVMTTIIIYGNGLIEWNHWTTRHAMNTRLNLTVAFAGRGRFAWAGAATHPLLEKTSPKVFFVLPFPIPSSRQCCIYLDHLIGIYATINTWTTGSSQGQLQDLLSSVNEQMDKSRCGGDMIQQSTLVKQTDTHTSRPQIFVGSAPHTCNCYNYNFSVNSDESTHFITWCDGSTAMLHSFRVQSNPKSKGSASPGYNSGWNATPPKFQLESLNSYCNRTIIF